MLSIIETAAKPRQHTNTTARQFDSNKRRPCPAESNSPVLYNGPWIWIIFRRGTRAAAGTVTAAATSGTIYILVGTEATFFC